MRLGTVQVGIPAQGQTLDTVVAQLPRSYKNKDRLRHDVQSLLQNYDSLYPSQRTFSLGRKAATLFHLYGVIPIVYRGSTYNIPITIYLDPGYPKAVPRFYVTPTKTMELKKGHPYVRECGNIILPSLQHWNSGRSSLVAIMANIACVFSNVPPVYAKSVIDVSTPPVHAYLPTGANPYALPAPVSAVFPTGPNSCVLPAVPPPPQTAHPQKLLTPPPVVAVQTSLPSLAAPMAPAEQNSLPTAQAVPASSHAPGRALMDGQCQVGLSTLETVRQKAGEQWLALIRPIVDESKEQLEVYEELQQRETELNKHIQNMQEELQACLSRESELTDIYVKLVGCVHDNPRKPDLEWVRDRMSPERQEVLDLLAEELAIEDYLVALDELLIDRKLTSDDYVQEIRDVSRRQYMCRVQLHKASKTVFTAVGFPMPVANEPGGGLVLDAAVSSNVPREDWRLGVTMAA